MSEATLFTPAKDTAPATSYAEWMASNTADPFNTKWTTADVEGIRYEIIKGELFVSKQPHWHHQSTCVKIASALESWSYESKLGVVIATPGVVHRL